MARAGGELAITQAAQDPAQCLLADRDAEFRIDPLRQINQPPAHHPVHRRVGTGLDDPLESRALLGAEQRPVTWCLAVDQPQGSVRVEGRHPVTHRLPLDTADRRRRAARGALVDRGQRQQAPGLVGISRGFRQRAQMPRIVILSKPQRRRHGLLLLLLALMKHRRAGLGSPKGAIQQDLV